MANFNDNIAMIAYRFKSMDMEHTVSAFALIIAATSISLVLLFTEVLCMIVIKVDDVKDSKSAFLLNIETP